MAQTNYTPIALYNSTTASAVPLAGNLVNGELAVNITDGKLYYKDNLGAVNLLASKAAASGSFTVPVVIEGATTDSALRITQNGTGNALLVEDSTTTDSTPFAIDSSGRVIAGYTSVDSSWFTTGNTPTVWQVANSANRNGFGSINYAGPGGLSLFRAGGGVIGTEGAVSSGDALGVIAFAGYDGINANAFSAAAITALVDLAPGNSSMPGRLVFSTTADATSAPVERMRINSNGAVGIGTTVLGPEYGLRVTKTLSDSTNGIGVKVDATGTSTLTSALYGNSTALATASNGGVPYTLANLIGYSVTQQGTFNADSTVTTQYGYRAEASLVGAATNYGFWGNIPFAANRWNLYMAGTASNYLGGQLQLGQDYVEKTNVANTSTAITLSLANGTFQILTLTGSPTITMPAAVAGKSFVILLKTGTGSFTVTWSTVKWPGGTAPTITSTASKQDIFSFFSDGTNWYGTTVGQNYTP